MSLVNISWFSEQKDSDIRNMFCHNCGKSMTQESRHCTYCGALRVINVTEIFSTFHNEANANPVERDSGKLETEETIFRIHPSFHKVGMAYILSALLALISTSIISYFGGSIIQVLVSSLVLFLLPVYQHFKQKNTTYTLTDTKLEIESGITSKTTHNLLLWCVQDVSVNQTLKDRLLGLGNVLVDSSVATDKIILKNIRHPRKYTNLILSQVHRYR